MKNLTGLLTTTPIFYVTPAKPSSEWTGKFQVREYSMLFISLGALLWLFPPLNFLIFTLTALTIYLIGETNRTRNQKFILVLGVLVAFVFLKYQFPRPAIKYVFWGRQGIEAFFLLRSIDFVLSKRPKTSLTGWDRFNQFLLYIFFLPTLFAGPVVSFNDFYKSYQPQISNWSQLVPYNLLKMTWGGIKFFVLTPYSQNLYNKLQQWAEGSVPHPFLQHLDPRLFLWGTFCLLLIRFYWAFSGFTDMAIALSRLLGFNLYENFANPLLSSSPVQYWKTSNISTYRWLMTHVFYPFWGHKQITAKILTTFLVSGLWHLLVTPAITWDAVIQLTLAFGSFGLAIAVISKISQTPWIKEFSLKVKSPGIRILLLALKTALTFSFIALIHRSFWDGITGKPLEVTLQAYQRLFFG
ncbi:MAG TPA: MBOAT family O-acyltransferase [Candidatus Limnocylindrales bacterium]|nr:MBOAT family O-acyltransferase [Candidatus Limnocylindrales bacterium]